MLIEAIVLRSGEGEADQSSEYPDVLFYSMWSQCTGMGAPEWPLNSFKLKTTDNSFPHSLPPNPALPPLSPSLILKAGFQPLPRAVIFDLVPMGSQTFPHFSTS